MVDLVPWDGQNTEKTGGYAHGRTGCGKGAVVVVVGLGCVWHCTSYLQYDKTGHDPHTRSAASVSASVPFTSSPSCHSIPRPEAVSSLFAAQVQFDGRSVQIRSGQVKPDQASDPRGHARLLQKNLGSFHIIRGKFDKHHKRKPNPPTAPLWAQARARARAREQQTTPSASASASSTIFSSAGRHMLQCDWARHCQHRTTTNPQRIKPSCKPPPPPRVLR